MKKWLYSIIEKTAELLRHLSRQNIGIHAAGAGYFIVLSIFPLLVLILALLRYTGLQVERLTDLLEGFLPNALMPAAKRLIVSTYQNTSGAVISLSALTGLWSASRGVYGLLTGLNAIYRVPESRGYFYTRGISMVYTVLFLLMLLITLVLNVFGTSLLQWLPLENLTLLQFLWELVDSRFLVMLLLQTVCRHVYGAAQPAQYLPGFSARRAAGICWLAGLFGYLLHLCGELFRLRQCIRLCIRGGAEYAVAVFLYLHRLLRRRAEPLSAAEAKKIIF